MFYSRITGQEVIQHLQSIKNPAHLTVDHNPNGEGSRQTLVAGLDEDGDLSTYFGCQGCIDGVDYPWKNPWTDGTYKGLFDLETTPYQFIKPEVYQTGDIVKVLESARDIPGFNSWSRKSQNIVGKESFISEVSDGACGVWYCVELEKYPFPAYCIQKINPAPFPDKIQIKGVDYIVTPELLEFLKTCKTA